MLTFCEHRLAGPFQSVIPPLKFYLARFPLKGMYCLSSQQNSEYLYFLVSRASDSVPASWREMFWLRGIMPWPKE